MNSAITKPGTAFIATGDMWSAIYDSRLDGDTGGEMLIAEMKVAAGGKDSLVLGSAKSKGSYLLLQNPTVNGLLNTNEVVLVNSKNKQLEIITAFPELATMQTLQAKLTEIREYESGFEAGLRVEVVSDAEGTDELAKVLQFFDTRYIANADKYKIGQVYNFHVGALVTSIKHRSKADLTIKLSKEARKTMWKTARTDQKTISTKHMFALNSTYDDNPEVFNCYTQFTGLRSPSYHYPLLTEKEELYLFEIRCHFFREDKPVYSIPAIMSDGVIVQSYKADKANSRKKLQFGEGDPVDIIGVLQGFLVNG